MGDIDSETYLILKGLFAQIIYKNPLTSELVSSHADVLVLR